MRGLARRSWFAAALLLLWGLVSLWHGRLQPVAPAQAVTLPQGWNLIANPGGIVAGGPAYTYQMGDTSYETVQPGTPLVFGLGYWVQSANRSALPLGAGSARATIQAPSGQFVMIGDPSGIFAAKVSGADVLLGYDPRTGYQLLSTNTLAPGQGAFALSAAGGEISIVAQGTSTASCSTADLGSACPTQNECPAGYPVAVTQDALAHPAPAATSAPVVGSIVLCFNDLTQAEAAGYAVAPADRITIAGPATATTGDLRVTVTRAILESPNAFLARVLASGDQVCSACDVSGATAIVTVEYGIDNLDRPPTLVSTGSFVSAHSPPETSYSYFLLASQHAADPVHTGSPVSGTSSGVFARTPLDQIDRVDWRLDDPLIDNVSPVLGPHGPSLSFELNFRGPRAGQIVAYGGGNGPLVPYNPIYTAVTPIPTVYILPAGLAGTAVPPPPQPTPAPQVAPAPLPTQQPSPLPIGLPSGLPPSINPNAPYTR